MGSARKGATSDVSNMLDNKSDPFPQMHLVRRRLSFVAGRDIRLRFDIHDHVEAGAIGPIGDVQGAIFPLSHSAAFRSPLLVVLGFLVLFGYDMHPYYGTLS